jgi:hypothetical protein
MPTKGYEVFGGGKYRLIVDRQFTDTVELGTWLGANYGPAGAEFASFLRQDIFDSQDTWSYDNDISANVLNTAVDKDGNILFTFKFHKGYLGLDGSIDITTASQLIKDKIIECVTKIVDLMP